MLVYSSPSWSSSSRNISHRPLHCWLHWMLYVLFTDFDSFLGFTGFSGFKRFIGFTGFSGFVGFTGFTGLSGFIGFTGFSGFLRVHRLQWFGRASRITCRLQFCAARQQQLAHLIKSWDDSFWENHYSSSWSSSTRAFSLFILASGTKLDQHAQMLARPLCYSK